MKPNNAIEPIYRVQNERVRPTQELVPWLDYLTPSVVLNKDGSLLAGFEYSALDPDNTDDELVDRAVDELERALVANFDERITLWWITKRTKDRNYLKQAFGNEVSGRVDSAYAKSFREGSFYRMKHWLFVLFTGNTGVDKFMDRVSDQIHEENKNPISAFLKALTGSVSTSAGFGRDMRQLDINLRSLEQIVGGFVGATPSISYKRLELASFDSALYQILNPAAEEVAVERPLDAMMDSWLPANEIVAGEDVIRFTGNRGDRYAAVYGIKRWPEKTEPMLLENLFASDNELVVCQIVRCMGRAMSEKVVTDVRNFHKMTQYSLFSTVMSKVSKRKPEPDAGKRSLYVQCEQALARLTAGGPTSAYCNVSVMLFDRRQERLEERCAELERLLAQKRILGIRERQNLLPSFAAMLPGQWAMQARYHLVNAENVAEMAPIFTMEPGPGVHPYFSEVLGKPVPPLAMFIDSYGCKFRFNPHVGQVGHALLIAPTESGKTTFVNFILSQFQKYGAVNTFVFDRDWSCKITTELHRGKHIDYKTGNMRLNPFALDDGTAVGRTWIREFIIRMLAESGFQCMPEDRNTIDAALAKMFDPESRDPKTLSTFATIVMSKNIELALGEWLKGGPYGLFDNEVDDFRLENWTTIEMKELQKIPRLLQMFMDYAFRRIDMKLDESGNALTFIYLEEASFLLQHPVFAKMIEDWLKTFRKKNAFVWLTIQSPDAIDGAVKAALVDNIKTTIYMYNKRVETHRKFYKSNFALTDAQIKMISELKPRREYMIVQDNFTRVIQTAFTPDTLLYLRSEKHLQGVFSRHQATQSENPNWREDYLAEAAQYKRTEYNDEELETEAA